MLHRSRQRNHDDYRLKPCSEICSKLADQCRTEGFQIKELLPVLNSSVVTNTLALIIKVAKRKNPILYFILYILYPLFLVPRLEIEILLASSSILHL